MVSALSQLSFMYKDELRSVMQMHKHGAKNFK